MSDKKLMVGQRVRRLRRERGLTQAEMARQLGISTSYLNLIERNQRPVTVQFLLKLGQVFDIDLQRFAADDESRVAALLKEVFGDPLFAKHDVTNQDIADIAAASPVAGEAVASLYSAYRDAMANSLGPNDANEGGDAQESTIVDERGGDPVAQVQEFIQSQGNYFAEIEEAAERLWNDAGLVRGELYSDLKAYLDGRHGIRARVMPVEVMRGSLWNFDHHSRRILLSEVLSPASRCFELAQRIAFLDCADTLDAAVARASIVNPASQRLCRLRLANYFAAAVLMPYDEFLHNVKELRYDIDILQKRFEVSYEQVCHRLTTLQKSGAKGIPFFMIRIDNAGNISKTLSASGFHFARFGGTCPRWHVNDVFYRPGRIDTEIVELPDGRRYFSIARTVALVGGGFHRPDQQLAIALGCDLADAAQLVYAEAHALDDPRDIVPIGVNCRLCERADCNQRAYPPLNRTLIVDENRRGISPYAFSAET